MDAALAWEIVGSVAAVLAVVIGVVQLRRDRSDLPPALLPSGLGSGPGCDPGPDLGQALRVVVGEIPQQPPGWQPRPGLLAALDTSDPDPRVVVVRAVTGMRGVGKTQLAAAFARSRMAACWQLVAWINAETLGGILAGLTATAAKLGQDQGLGAEAAGRAVRHWLETGGQDCLLVFDNATDPELIQPYLPASGAARVIITSNQQSVASLGTAIGVEVFSEAEALAYLADRTKRDDEAGARAVGRELGWLPLALAQAAAVIVAQHLDYAAYLGRLRQVPVSELLAPVPAGQYPRGVAAAVLLSVGAVTDNDGTGACGGVMDLLAVLSAAGVRRSLVHSAAARGLLRQDGTKAGLRTAAADEALGRLAGASLLTFTVNGAAVTVHRLVSRIIREQLAAAEDLAAVCQAAVGLLTAQAEELRDAWHEDRAAARDLADQVTALHQAAALCPDDDHLTQTLLQLRGQAGMFLNHLGDSAAQAILIGETLLADCERILGADHLNTLASLNNLGISYWTAGRTAEAITLDERALADRERILGADHPDTLTSRSNLAVDYRNAGRTAEAVSLDERALADRERVLGADHPATLTSRSNLANAYLDAGRTAEAITLHERALADRERVLGADHPATLTSRSNLANAYLDAGRTAEAITLHERALADRERILGADHPDTIASRDNLAIAYRKRGQTKKRRSG
jgi:tetratricopeptide (TPR) repeat protein